MASKSEKRSWKKKGDFIYNPDSNLIIKSAKEKVVIGRFDEDGNKVEDEKTLELCKEYGLDPATSLLEALAERDEKEKSEDENEDDKEDDNEDDKEDENENEDDKEDEQKEDPPKRSSPSTREDKKAPVKKEKESAQRESVQRESVQRESSQNRDLSSLLETFAKQVESIVNGHVQRNRELEEQLNSTRKELEETKKKLKKILSDMMDKL